ncbi:COG1525 Micrococcal nuclease (thermonuclease) homologs [uncultured Caudovirales phage]|uniref:COG1525 Micrococcal nuclease (Thermonuclease) homologs n=1 Tax=uncultured Caudovirales phage TaxID=2100421 RepID=A0A6J5RFZ7_9CAUD|nr:COG1525 Micrococcal nuclease (thermonuclease) homologs [uncultured Caudovirales phage]CAB4193376.1 COG1525 Micrococcal nuclease (thermonuclease) homologs [uncultured Caudovirales phage]CAB4217918.1 COG1525 Micrococcal nuclease (thermonuclease) homologs [uncultured Caudovirales phage]CAB5231114.1 COG1525 Micrococcal nuclease (thermonuclease) homologs [uncultured Caudovirales phage]
MSKYIFTFLLAVLLSSFMVQTEAPPLKEITAVQPLNLVRALVIKVTDADGCWVLLPDGRKKKYRFCGIDAPETKNGIICAAQPHSYVSRDSVRALILNQYILLDTLPQGKVARSYDRTIADIYSADSIPIFLNHYIVSKGWAWGLQNDKRINPVLNTILLEASAKAQADRIGLFGVYLPSGKYLKPVLPYTWRKNHRCSDLPKTGAGT